MANSMIKRVAISTGGGDAPGLNAVIRAAVKTAVGEYGVRIVGIEDSFEGCLGEMRVRELTPADVRGLLPRGGTILGTRNRGCFVKHDDEGADDGREASYEEAIDNLKRFGIEALVVLGGADDWRDPHRTERHQPGRYERSDARHRRGAGKRSGSQRDFHAGCDLRPRGRG